MEGVQDSTVEDPGTGPSGVWLIPRFRRSLGYAWNGLGHVFKHHPNLRMELVLMVFSIGLALVLRVNPLPIIISWGLVVAFEVMNTAVELVVDLISPDYSRLAGLAKDTSAAAVLVTAITTAIVNIWVLLPPLLQLIGLVNP